MGGRVLAMLFCLLVSAAASWAGGRTVVSFYGISRISGGEPREHLLSLVPPILRKEWREGVIREWRKENPPPDILYIEPYEGRTASEHGGATPLELVTRLKRNSPGTRIVLLIRPPANGADTANAAQRGATIRQVAYETKTDVLDLHTICLDLGDSSLSGRERARSRAMLVARRLGADLTLAGLPGFSLVSRLAVKGEGSSYHGFDCTLFRFEGREARIVQPRRTAAGAPWVWRARFWGHEPQTEIALLERGFHLVYCDVSELFGNDDALGIWDRFYRMLVDAGLNCRSAFIGFSRGGIYTYRWASKHPDRVSCVYVDAPVLDLKSWPGGKGKGAGNPAEWERFKTDFGLRSEEEGLAFRGNPLDLAEELARGGYPMLHICGDADPVVPIDENTDPFERRVTEAGGRIHVIRKPGVGHHPHSLRNPTLIVDFILRATRTDQPVGTKTTSPAGRRVDE